MSQSAPLKIALVEAIPIESLPAESPVNKNDVGAEVAEDIIQDTPPADQNEQTVAETTQIQFPVSSIAARVIRQLIFSHSAPRESPQKT